MAEKNRHAVARIVLTGQQHIAIIRAVDGMLVMSLLNFDHEIKKPSMFKDEISEVEPAKKETELAMTLLEASTETDFDFSQYHDDYESDVTKLIESKSKGKKLSDRRSAEEPAVINLMDALKKSLDEAQKNAKKAQHHAHRNGSRRKTG